MQVQAPQQDAFVDFYEVLQISPNAQMETIQRVYRLLAQLYHPDNTETGSVEAFNLVLEAYRILSDPERRAAYDVEHRTVTGHRWKIFEESTAVQGVEGEKRKRVGILSLLYNKRIQDPDHPTLGVLELEQLLGCPREHLQLSLWYLRESQQIRRSDNGRWEMTAKGLETLEASTDPHKEAMRVRLLPAASESSNGSGS